MMMGRLIPFCDVYVFFVGVGLSGPEQISLSNGKHASDSCVRYITADNLKISIYHLYVSISTYCLSTNLAPAYTTYAYLLTYSNLHSIKSVERLMPISTSYIYHRGVMPGV